MTWGCKLWPRQSRVAVFIVSRKTEDRVRLRTLMAVIGIIAVGLAALRNLWELWAIILLAAAVSLLLAMTVYAIINGGLWLPKSPVLGASCCVFVGTITAVSFGLLSGALFGAILHVGAHLILYGRQDLPPYWFSISILLFACQGAFMGLIGGPIFGGLIWSSRLERARRSKPIPPDQWTVPSAEEVSRTVEHRKEP
jgi:hypothetical protein